MKGLEVSRRFFFEWGLPFIEREFPGLRERVAAGLSGGSDAIGADDRLSRDHDWGPQFQLWLTAQDFQRFGRRLRREINAAAPEVFLGVRHHFFGGDKDGIDVLSIDGFFRGFGWRHPPTVCRDWFKRRGADALVDKESWLYFMKHGPLYHDPLGEFTARKEAFSHYPRDVRYKLMAGLCLGIWADGEYKFCRRDIHRKDPVLIYMRLASFAHEVMRLCFLLNDDYAPHLTWLHHEFRRLPEARALGPRLRRLVTSTDLEERRDLVLTSCRYLRCRLYKAGLIDSPTPDYGMRCMDIEKRIEDRSIREM
jgi:diadenosine tetraphosphatase ApaH/serine/threonine PP2A family protein phosphatase